ncbi:LysM peptidoglycan-binding domain-containing protein [Paenibacillus pasadenensis]|uniref:Phage-like element PBSX protein xkdP n=1 Tax=Paenibacillus pasadenensis TaxID=217090 RepID=A0A2N5N9R7_9BACL|nr:LysM peptidoglycan-binding domain-containing protein [Paenibacillus pasadenensis]PLT47073.1 Phage-like element PBSX protein xkdP [Paenibacillus pasadenensis]
MAIPIRVSPQPAKAFAGIRLDFNHGTEGWELPVMPSKLSIRRSGSGKDYNLLGAGPIATIEKPGLAEVEFESFFPSQPGPYVATRSILKRPEQFADDIGRWMRSGYPLRFIYARHADRFENPYTLQIPMTITGFDRWEEAGSPGDVFYTLKLKEYVFYAPVKLQAVKTADGSTAVAKEPDKRPDLKVPPKAYTIVKGDTLSGISMKLYDGDSSRWPEIQKLNGIGNSELKRLQIGRVLQVPPPKE